MKKITILVPAYNEEENITTLLQQIIKVQYLEKTKVEIILVDDGSTDDTYKKARQFFIGNKNRNYEYKIVGLYRNSGKTAAIKAGVEKMTGDILVLMDADLQDNPSYIPKFLRTLESKNKDIIVGNRTNRYKNNSTKYLSSHLANWLMRTTTKNTYHDMNCGFKVMTKEVILSINLKRGYHRYIPLLASIRGFNGGEINIKQRKRLHGESKYGKTGLTRMIKSFMDMVSIIFIYKFKEKPFDLFGRTGFVSLAIGTLILIYLSIGWLFGKYIFGRPLFFLGILLVIIGINIISLGLLGEIMSDKNINNKGYIIKNYYQK